MKRLGCILLLLLAACAESTDHPIRPITPHLTDQAMIAGDGAVLPLRRWLPDGEPRAVIVGLHGFDDYSEAFALPAPSLVAAGIALYAYDQRGFGQAPQVGRWPGADRLRGDLYQMLRLLAARYPGRPLFVLGESMGGAVALTALSHPQIDHADIPRVSGVILSAPAVWSRDQMPWYQDAALWLGDHLVPWMTLTGRGLHIEPSDNLPMLRRLSQDPLVIKETRISAIKGLCDLMDEASQAPSHMDLPTLVLVGKHDEVVPAEASEAMLAQSGPSVQTRFYPDGYHMLLRDLHADRPLRDITEWILESHSS